VADPGLTCFGRASIVEDIPDPRSRVTVRASFDSSRDERRTTLVVFIALLALYLATLAPDVTLWDAGEFNAAIASLGIPHPPGTPLYVLLARVWSRALGFLPQVVAVNALSAVATACGCALLARLLTRWTRSALWGIAAGLGAGVTFSLWQNATETEVYAISFLLAVATLVAGDAAGRAPHARRRALLVYLLALAVPVQISALVAAPAAILLAANFGAETTISLRTIASLGGAFVLVTGIGLVSPQLMSGGLVLLVATILVGPGTPEEPKRWEVVAFSLLAMIGASATLYMLVRASHDPGINQGNPSTWRAFIDVIARRQYDVPPLWPRRVPFWLQLGNLAQYADWQVAFGLDSSVAPSWWRTPWSVVFGVISVIGARCHWRRDVRTARAFLILLLAATLGVVVVLNLRAGPSIGAHWFPSDDNHEARERDYFFALGFAVAGAWMGLGATTIAAWILRRRAWMGVTLAALPAAFNWAAANRRRLPDAILAPSLGVSLLESTPERAVLLLAGDNDSYSIWFEQQARGMRRDVTPITLPLLGADWYRAELSRRDSLFAESDVATWGGEEQALRTIAANATRLGRPLSAAVSVGRQTRRSIRPSWELRGLVYLATAHDSASPLDSDRVRVDAASTRALAQRVEQWLVDSAVKARDPAGRYVQRLLLCPRRTVGSDTKTSRQPLAPAIGC
jgi:transmembrane protein TMEM260 (protein O-mannosyltransferase)